MQSNDGLEILHAMRQGVDYSSVITIRGFSLRVRPLSMLETLQVAETVQRELQLKDEFSKHRLSEHTILARETLRKASSSDINKGDSPITEYIMERMTPEEWEFLFKQYVAVVDKKNPALELMTEEQVLELVEQVKKSPDGLALALTELSFLQLASISHALILAASPPAK